MSNPRRSAVAELHRELEHASELLPAQGPLSVFVHHNTLHALEHLTFEEAVLQAGHLLDCQPYMPEHWYREVYTRGRILDRDLVEVVRQETTRGELVGGVLSRRDLRRALLRHQLHSLDGPALSWHLAETEALQRFRPEVDRSVRQSLQIATLHWMRSGFFAGAELQGLAEAGEEVAVKGLWRACEATVERLPAGLVPTHPIVRPRDALVRAGGSDPDALVHPLLIRLAAAYLDQGQALVAMPGREKGFHRCVRELYRAPGGMLPAWAEQLPARLRDESHRQLEAEDSIQESLAALGIPPESWGPFLRDTLLALKGWAGMFHQAELRPDRMPHESVPARLADFVAVRLLLDRCALEYLGPPSGSAVEPDTALPSHRARTYELFQLAQFLGLDPDSLMSWSAAEVQAVFRELDAFGELGRRRLFHLAYERRLRVVTLDALHLHPRWETASPPAFQAIFCIDEREESTRRHLEEVAPECETFAAAGFFGIPMYFQAVHETRPVPLCPIVLRPRHLVREIPHEAHEAERLAILRKSLGHVAHGVQVGSQTLAWGGVLTSGLGLFSALPAFFRVLFPRAAGQLGRSFRKRLVPAETSLQLERAPGATADENGLLPGFTAEEMAGIVATQLEELGLTQSFAPLVLVVGHGSSSLNNPHESAHDCGACGGGRGGPNARAFARMANHAEVRRLLAERGLPIPAETVFVGAYHNTCDDDLDLYDLAELSEEQVPRLERAVRALNAARSRDALERCRRFELKAALSPRRALAHVEGRAEDLAQPRPEYGHATNAVLVVGRRARTRGLFLDRRAFLQSYDPTRDDPHGTVLGRILRAVVPVGAGINLEYYFSFVDNTGYGCGTKLPHNITARLGVMDGPSSDLRTGLPWQMVEIHEPVRLLVVIEGRRAALEAALEREVGVRRLVENRWIQLALLAPDSSRIEVLEQERWTEYHPEARRLPRVASSTDWFHQHRDHLFFAEVKAG